MLIEKEEVEAILTERADEVSQHIVTGIERREQHERLIMIVKEGGHEAQRLAGNVHVGHQIDLEPVIDACRQDELLTGLDDQAEASVRKLNRLKPVDQLTKVRENLRMIEREHGGHIEAERPIGEAFRASDAPAIEFPAA